MTAWLNTLLLALSLVSLATTTSLAGEVGNRRAEALAFNCFTCHGSRGEGPAAMKSLADLTAAEIRAKLRAFKRGEEDPTIMNRIAKAYSDEEIALIADYIANLD